MFLIAEGATGAQAVADALNSTTISNISSSPF